MDQSILSQRVFSQVIDCSQMAAGARQAGWDIDCGQISRGGFDAWISRVSCGQLAISCQSSNREVAMVGTPPPDTVAVILPFRGERLGTFQGKPLGPDEGIVLRPEDGGILCSLPDVRVFGVSVPKDQLEFALRSCGRRQLSQACPESQSITFSLPLFHRLTEMVSVGAPGGLGQASRASVLEFEDDVLQLIAEGLCGQAGHSEQLERRLKNRVRIVQLARDYIEAHLKSEILLSQVAVNMGVSRRTLEFAFRDVMGLTPLQYVRMRRLNRVRQQLLESDSENWNVTALAMENGFSHLGHFARVYKALFGELPSVTLKKRKFP